MQGVAAEELRRLTEIAFNEAHLTFTTLTSFVTLRRLTLHVEGLAGGAAGLGRSRNAGRASARRRMRSTASSNRAPHVARPMREARDRQGREFYFAIIKRAGQATKDMLPPLLIEVIRTVVAEMMRFPAAPFRWVRPLQSVVRLLDGRIRSSISATCRSVWNRAAIASFLKSDLQRQQFRRLSRPAATPTSSSTRASAAS